MAQGDYAQAEKTLAEAAENFTAAKDAPGLAAIAANRAQLDEARHLLFAGAGEGA